MLVRHIFAMATRATAAAVAVAVFAGPAAAQELASAAPSATSAGFALQQTTRRDDAPPRDPVGGFQVSVFGGVQLRGSAAGQAGLAVAYFRRSTGNVGLELEGGFTRGPSGEIYHGLLSAIFQSGSRAQKLAPYVAIGGGVYQARERLRDAVAEALPSFGIDVTAGEETGALIAFGLGFRYHLSEKTSFRADYREFRALTTGDGGFFDRLFSLRRIAGFLSFQF